MWLRTSLLLLLTTAGAGSAQTGMFHLEQEPGERWVVTDEALIPIRLINLSEQPVFIDSIRVTLPNELVCGSRQQPATVHGTGEPLTPGDTTRLLLPVGEGGAGCTISTLLDLGLSRATVNVWYIDPIYLAELPEIEPHTTTINLAWSAPILMVLFGAFLGVIMANVVLILAGQTGRMKVQTRGARRWLTEIAYGSAVVLVVVMLARLLTTSEQPEWVRGLLSERFGPGFLLGLTFNGIGLVLMGVIRKGRDTPADSPPQSGGESAPAVGDAETPPAGIILPPGLKVAHGEPSGVAGNSDPAGRVSGPGAAAGAVTNPGSMAPPSQTPARASDPDPGAGA